MSDYINTPFGKMPSDWKVLKSSKVIKYLGGNAFKSQDGTEDGVRWLKIANVGIEKPRWTEISYLPDEYLNEFDKYRLEEGDIVMALTRPILSDRLKVCKLGPEDVPALLNQRVAKLETVSQGALLNYYYHFVQTPYFVNRMNVEMAGTDPPNISVSSLNSIEVPVPPLPEQKKIAKILSTVDGHIDEVDGMIEDLKELKKGLMQKLLTEGIGHTEFKDSEVGRIPDTWEIKTVNEISTRVCVGFVGSCSKYYCESDVGIPMIRTTNLSNGKVKLNDLKYVTKEFHNKNVKSQLKKGDILVARHGENGQASLYHIDDEANSLNIVIIRPDNDVNSLYLSEAINSEYVRKQVSSALIGSVQNVVNTKAIANLKIAVPTLEEQEKISAILASMDGRISIYEEELTSFCELKKGLMQQLLTGKTRVKIDN